MITLGALFFCLAKLYYMTSQILFPWYLQPHALYSDSIPASVVAGWEFLSASAFGTLGTLWTGQKPCDSLAPLSPRPPVPDLPTPLSSSAFATHPSFGLRLATRKLLHMYSGSTYVLFFITWFAFRGFDVGPELLWFVLGNVAVHALALYAEYLFAESHRQIEELKGVRYPYNKP